MKTHKKLFFTKFQNNKTVLINQILFQRREYPFEIGKQINLIEQGFYGTFLLAKGCVA